MNRKEIDPHQFSYPPRSHMGMSTLNSWKKSVKCSPFLSGEIGPEWTHRVSSAHDSSKDFTNTAGVAPHQVPAGVHPAGLAPYSNTRVSVRVSGQGVGMLALL